MSKLINKVESLLDKKEITNKNTRETYLGNFKRVFELLNEPKTYTPFKNFEKVDKLIKDNIKSVPTLKQTYSTIGFILDNVRGYKTVSKQYKEVAAKLTKDYSLEMKKNDMTERQKDKLVNYSELKKMLNDTPLESLDRRYVLMYLYIMPELSPRGTEYLNALVYYNDDEVDNNENYFLVKGNKVSFVMNEYKTKKFFGKIKYDYSKKDSKVILNYLEDNNRPNVVFGMSRQALHKMMNKYLGLSTQFIRTIKNNNYIKSKKFKNMSLEKQKENMIKLFQHNLDIGLEDYKKDGLK